MTADRAQVAALGAALDAAEDGARLVYLAGSVSARDAARQVVGDLVEADGDLVEAAGAAAAPLARYDAPGGGWLRIQGVGDGAPVLAGPPGRVIADPAAVPAVLAHIAAAWAASRARRA